MASGNNVPFDTRSSEWMGDMTVWLRENSEDNSAQIERLIRNLRLAREQDLTDRQRQMLKLHYDQQMSVTEISRQLGVNPSTVSRTLRRARERLRHALKYSF